MYNDGTCSSTTAADGTVTRDPCPDAYGMVLGEQHPPTRLGHCVMSCRNLHGLRVLGNLHVVRPRSSPEADFPTHGYWSVLYKTQS